MTFSLNDDNELRIAYEATTDKTTVINLTNHTYFNLAGGGTILDEVLTLHADAFTPVDATLIPTGEIRASRARRGISLTRRRSALIKETGGKPVGLRPQLRAEKGWFSNWAVAAEVDDPKTGRTLTVSTDQPGIQFYSGNFLDGTLTGKGGNVYRQYDGFALETQHFPDSPNHANFPRRC